MEDGGKEAARRTARVVDAAAFDNASVDEGRQTKTMLHTYLPGECRQD
jgi:hypothetical protein